jgi:protein CLEC16A
VQSILTPLFFGDQNDVRFQWASSLQKGLHLEPRAPEVNARDRCFDIALAVYDCFRLFFYSHLSALREGPDDHSTFYALLLIYAICQNRDVISGSFLEAAKVPELDEYNVHLMKQLILILESCSQQETPIRAVTMELCGLVLRRLMLALDIDESAHTFAETTVQKLYDEIVVRLRHPLTNEDLFLEMFEEEYFLCNRNQIKINVISTDAGLYLPPSNTPMSGLLLSHRLPCGNEERIRRLLQFFFLTRRLLHDLRGETETELPLSSKLQTIAEVNDCINLNNSDLLACTVVTSKGEKVSRFLVTDKFQLILVEPDSRKLGWAIVRFVGLLQDTHAAGDTSDSRTLHVVVEDVKCRVTKSSQPVLSAKLVFDDYIRCMAAKQRLNKGRKTSREFKITLIRSLLGWQPEMSLAAERRTPRSSPSPAYLRKGSAPGTVRKVSNPPRSEDSYKAGSSKTSGSPVSIPDDPDTTSSSSSKVPPIRHI